MSSLKLDLKYRPANFRDVLGNDGVKKLLLIRSKQGTLRAQSMMFGGPKGCGKTSLARIVAKAMVCSSVIDGEPCGSCPSCIAVADGTHQDVEELDAASQGTVDKIRSMVQDADYVPIGGSPVRIYIIDEAQRLSRQAQDALLRAIEDRILHVILCTTEPHKIQGPIRDRLEEYPIRPPDQATVTSKLTAICSAERIDFEPAAIDMIVSLNSCTPRSCIMSVATIHVSGSVTVEAVRDLFRFSSHELIDSLLTSLDSDIKTAFSVFDKLSGTESATWVRDDIIAAIAGAVRSEAGVRSGYPITTHFYQTRRIGWVKVAQNLGHIDRPTFPDILVSLLPDKILYNPLPESIHSTPAFSVATPPSVSAPMPTPAPAPPPPIISPPPILASQPMFPESSPLPSPPSPVVKPMEAHTFGSVEVDGVRFTDNETLTSLDGKVKSIPGATPDLFPTANTSELVEFNRDRVPITEKEFVSGLLGRLRSTER